MAFRHFDFEPWLFVQNPNAFWGQCYTGKIFFKNLFLCSLSMSRSLAFAVATDLLLALLMRKPKFPWMLC